MAFQPANAVDQMAAMENDAHGDGGAPIDIAENTVHNVYVEGEDHSDESGYKVTANLEPPLFGRPLSEKAFPLADETITKLVLEIVTHATDNKTLKQSVNQVKKTISTGSALLVVLAADHSPIEDLLSIPALCEEKRIPYVFVHSREILTRFARLDRPTSAVVVSENLQVQQDMQRINLLAEMVERLMI